ncbi:MAG: DUF370 domain-containing protein [Thermaerobacter sp.]|nr:DUF370 domain-containing protein [Thermaerobacter sp.]
MTVRLSEVIAILDLQRAAHAPASREYLEVARSEHRLEGIPSDTKSLVITAKTIFPSPISSITLARRAAAKEVF